MYETMFSRDNWGLVNFANRRLVLLSILIFLISIYSYGLFNYTVDTDVPVKNRNIYSFTKDQNGILWFGTSDGIALYDGYDVTNFYMPFGHAGYRSPVKDIACFDDEIFFLVQGSTGAFKFNPQQNEFSIVFSDSTHINKRFSAIEKIGDSILVLSTFDNDLLIYTEDTVRKLSFDTNGVLRTISKDNDNNIWLFTNKKIFKTFDGEVLGEYEYPDVAKSRSGVVVVENALFDNENIIFSVWGKGVFYTSRTKIIKGEYQHLINEDELSGPFVLCIEKNGKGDYYIGTDYGITVLQNVNGFLTKKAFLRYELAYGGLTSNIIRSIYYDNEDILWLGTLGGGINKIIESEGMFDNLVNYYPNSSKTHISSAIIRIDDEFLIGNQSTGFLVYNPSNKQCVSWKDHPKWNKLSDNINFDLNTVLSFFRKQILGKDLLFIGTRYAGLLIVDLNEYPKKESILRQHVSGGSVFCIKDGPGLSVSIGLTSALSLLYFYEEAGVFKMNVRWLANKEFNTSLPHVLDVDFCQKDSCYYVASSNAGFGKLSYQNWMDKRTYTFTVLNDLIKDRESDFNAKCNDILNCDSVIYIGTMGSGLLAYYPTDSVVKQYTSNNGLFSDNIYSISNDLDGNIWLASDNGIFSFAGTDGSEFVRFGLDDGLSSTHFLTNSSYKFENQIFFGSYKGIVGFNPKDVKKSEFKPPLLITKVHILNRKNKNRYYNFWNLKHIVDHDKLVLNPNDYTINIELSSLSYRNPIKNQYAYMLEGYDKEWNYTDAYGRKVSYNNLKPGIYNFLVKSSNSGGKWNNDVVEMSIEIVPPFWKTLWFAVVSLIVIVVLLYSLYLLRLRRLQSRNELLQKVVDERTLELKEKNEKLEKIIFNKNRFFSILAHDLRNPFGTLMGLSDILRERFSEIETNEMKRIINTIADETKMLYNLLENLLHWGKNMFIEKHEVEKTQVYIYSVVLRTIDLLRNNSKKVTIEMDIEKDLSVLANNDYLDFSIRNIVGNAIKYSTTNDVINISALKEGLFAKIRIADKGVGMSEEQLLLLFNNSKIVSKSGTAGEKGTGLGLLNCKDFIESMNGKIEVKSKLGEGTVFTLILPIYEANV